MGRLPDTFMNEVRAVDIVNTVGRHVKLKKRGKDYFGLCPFHQEKTPSFSVSPGQNAFFCFGCHEGGDNIRFLMLIEGLQFMEAVKKLADDASLPMPERTPTFVDQRAERMRDACQRALDLYRQGFAGSDSEKYMLEERGFARETLDKFKIGHAPQNGSFLSKYLPQHVQLLMDAGIIAKVSGQPWDMLRQRVVIPVFSPDGRISSLAGRALRAADKAKYMSCKDSPICKKGGTLFGLQLARKMARKKRRIHVVEGYFDVMALHEIGVENVVCSMGTAFTTSQARILAREAPQVVLVFDGDEAGKKGARQATPTLLEAGAEVKVVLLPKGQDPFDFVRSDPPGVVEQFLSHQAADGVEFMVKHDLEHGDESVQGKSRVAKAVMEDLKKCKDEYVRDAGIELLSRETGIRREVLASEGDHRIDFDNVTDRYKKTPKTELSVVECMLLGLVVSDMDAMEVIRSMPDLSIVDDMPVGPMLRMVLGMEDDVTPASALSRAEGEEGKALMHKSITEIAKMHGTLTALGCWTAVRRKWMEHQLEELQRSIEMADSLGDPALDDLLKTKTMLMRS